MRELDAGEAEAVRSALERRFVPSPERPARARTRLENLLPAAPRHLRILGAPVVTATLTYAWEEITWSELARRCGGELVADTDLRTLMRAMQEQEDRGIRRFDYGDYIGEPSESFTAWITGGPIAGVAAYFDFYQADYLSIRHHPLVFEGTPSEYEDICAAAGSCVGVGALRPGYLWSHDGDVTVWTDYDRLDSFVACGEAVATALTDCSDVETFEVRREDELPIQSS